MFYQESLIALYNTVMISKMDKDIKEGVLRCFADDARMSRMISLEEDK